MLKILCTLLNIYCTAPLGTYTKTALDVVQLDPFYDVTVRVPPCLPGVDATAMLQAAIDEAQRLQPYTTPLSDAAGVSTEGATVRIQFSGGTCAIAAPVSVPSWAPVILDGNNNTTLMLSGENGYLSYTQRPKFFE